MVLPKLLGCWRCVVSGSWVSSVPGEAWRATHSVHGTSVALRRGLEWALSVGDFRAQLAT